MDFYELEENITKYIEDNFTSYLQEANLTKPAYVKDVIDLDKYKYSFTIFFDYASFKFENLSNESHKASVSLDLYFVRRNGIPEALKRDLLNYVSKFYKWFYNNISLGGIIDYGTITELNNYDAASGDKGIKITQITLDMELELEDY